MCDTGERKPDLFVTPVYDNINDFLYIKMFITLYGVRLEFIGAFWLPCIHLYP